MPPSARDDDPDPKAAAFRQEARRLVELLRGTPEEQEALGFIEVVADWDDEA